MSAITTSLSAIAATVSDDRQPHWLLIALAFAALCALFVVVIAAAVLSRQRLAATPRPDPVCDPIEAELQEILAQARAYEVVTRAGVGA